MQHTYFPPITVPALTQEERYILFQKGTERAFSGEYTDKNQEGVYYCRNCGHPLFLSTNKFHSPCGWPSFDDSIPSAVVQHPDTDGHRVEILCANCQGHLGHVFLHEGFTPKNIRHCVNSLALFFKPQTLPLLETAIFAGGCFWGIEDFFRMQAGVVAVESGYTGGRTDFPSYEEVCTGQTGHAEAVRVLFDKEATCYETLAKLFFELHDPTQRNRQGPDKGTQYRSCVFYTNQAQKKIAKKLCSTLIANGYDIVTEILPDVIFFPAESYHQKFLQKSNKQSCHSLEKRFEKKASRMSYSFPFYK